MTYGALFGAAVLAWAAVLFAVAWTAGHLGHASFAETLNALATAALAFGLLGAAVSSGVKRLLGRHARDLRKGR